ncbi:DUF1541 domain-containing protein [Planococcus sp. ISL-109]|uniref:YdhK family protein n=1 Tax=Planococcus sp. ISL-109 TaxID=2819166 RepID=UPI001BE85C2D|nr:DUF1541 domain-containing protein [Planococcus sp. ISL-109]MBT2583897.1 DUF1541 domain-containing protein [Planococcus sp. ISL-109]
MIRKRVLFASIIIAMIFSLGACFDGVGEDTTQQDEPVQPEWSGQTDLSNSGGNHTEMEHSSSGEVPVGLEEAVNPTYPVDSTATIQADHMPGMDGAIATISGAFDTTAYSVSYTPVNGGEAVENHKWVIHEELEKTQAFPYAEGDAVMLDAEHMTGMKGASAAVDSAEQTTVYMINFEDTKIGEEITNHQWVTESELTVE